MPFDLKTLPVLQRFMETSHPSHLILNYRSGVSGQGVEVSGFECEACGYQSPTEKRGNMATSLHTALIQKHIFDHEERCLEPAPAWSVVSWVDGTTFVKTLDGWRTGDTAELVTWAHIMGGRGGWTVQFEPTVEVPEPDGEWTDTLGVVWVRHTARQGGPDQWSKKDGRASTQFNWVAVRRFGVVPTFEIVDKEIPST